MNRWTRNSKQNNYFHVYLQEKTNDEKLQNLHLFYTILNCTLFFSWNGVHVPRGELFSNHASTDSKTFIKKHVMGNLDIWSTITNQKAKKMIDIYKNIRSDLKKKPYLFLNSCFNYFKIPRHWSKFVDLKWIQEQISKAIHSRNTVVVTAWSSFIRI